MSLSYPSKQNSMFHWAWVILALCFVNLFISYGIRLGYGIVLPEMIRTLGINRRQGGDIFNAYLFAYITISPITGYLTDRFGARKVISSFGILLGTGALLMGTIGSFMQGCLAYVLVGIGASAMWIPVLTVAQRWFSIRKRGMALGIMSTGFGLGFAVMGRLFPVIVEKWNWRYCWYVLGAAALAMVFINAFLLRSKPEEMGLQPWGEKLGEGSDSERPTEAPNPHARSYEFLSTSRFWLIGLSYFMVAASLYAVTTYMVDYARHNLGFSYEKASLLATIHGLGQILGVLTIPIVSDYIGRRLTIIVSNFIIAGSIASIILSGNHPYGLWASVVVFGAFYGATFPMYGACGGDYFRKEVMGRVIGAWTPLYGLGAIIGHRFGGYFRDVTGSFSIPFQMAVLTALVASALMLFVKRPTGNPSYFLPTGII